MAHEIPTPAATVVQAATVTELAQATWRRTVFHASPIGKTTSKFRRHANLIRDTLVRPAVALVDDKMKVIRGDELKSSPITSDILEHIDNCGLMVADLSFGRPNVLYEVGRRHRPRKPLVLIMRDCDPIPSNLKEERIVFFDPSEADRYHAQQGGYVEELAGRIRWALSNAA
jgi:hypothetical protein